MCLLAFWMCLAGGEDLWSRQASWMLHLSCFYRVDSMVKSASKDRTCGAGASLQLYLWCFGCSLDHWSVWEEKDGSVRLCLRYLNLQTWHVRSPFPHSTHDFWSRPHVWPNSNGVAHAGDEGISIQDWKPEHPLPTSTFRGSQGHHPSDLRLDHSQAGHDGRL